ncbi:LytR/AlgR family response regulator transcription factor [Granulicella tundricola]|uniref:Two component transcriptional regulator, LytTR family n=1 Tax=Granulicella tundricola (strain ATCC BAA-1859 / DSM 23138 / MP5ACTX9) TaxID=1198114 RepID=E8X1I2_GRATM|nr:LytTR family DNA-binding domain-containing protein [Granulicella tundricola]ADW70217.1 two component transcriptional regulator, LytTR family [Granulicella tundricola MP5ACTX9]
MPLKVVIVDDELLARQELQYLVENAGDVQVLALGSNGIEAVDLIHKHKPDLVFLDVQMPGLDGFGVLKKLLEKKARLPQVVFATAYDQYAVRAFEVNAVDYLLKPFDKSRIERTIAKARERVALVEASIAPDSAEAKLDALLRLVEEASQTPKVQRGKIVLRAQNRLMLVDQKEICFVSIEDGAISVVTPAMEGQSNCRTLEELMEQLDPEAFWRAHRSYVVNIQHIREVVPWFKSSYQLRMDDPKKTEIPVSRNQTKRLRELFNL